jgi:hypothetical protein
VLTADMFTVFGQYHDDACKFSFYHEMEIGAEFLQAHNELQGIVEQVGYPKNAEEPCDRLLGRLRTQADQAFGRALLHRPPVTGLQYPLTFSEWKAEIQEQAEERVDTLKKIEKLSSSLNEYIQ